MSFTEKKIFFSLKFIKNVVKEIENGNTAINTAELLQWLELKYQARLKLYPGIKSDAPIGESGVPAHTLFRLTSAAQRLRVIRGAIDWVSGIEPDYISKAEIVKSIEQEMSQIPDFSVHFEYSFKQYNNLKYFLTQTN